MKQWVRNFFVGKQVDLELLEKKIVETKLFAFFFTFMFIYRLRYFYLPLYDTF